MANSTIVLTLKDKIINALCEDPDIDSLIDSQNYHGKNLRGKHIFNSNKNPETITETITFITVMTGVGARDRTSTFVTSKVIINIYTHNEHMELPPEYLKDDEYFNRNDYLSFLIDEKFNGSTEYGGFGKLKLVLNDEYTPTKSFNARMLKFETVDINDSLCDRW